MKLVIRLIGIIAIVALLLVAGLVVSAKMRMPAFVPGEPPVLPAHAQDGQAIASRLASAPAVQEAPSADSILEGALEALSGLDSWHLEMAMDVAAHFRSLNVEFPAAYRADFKAPDRLEGTASVQLLGIVLEKDTILVANTLTITDPEIGVAAGSAFSLLAFGGFDLSDFQDLEFVGEETLDDIPVYHLKGTLPTGKVQTGPGDAGYAFEGKVQFEVWIGVADSLPRQGVAEGKLATWGPAEGTIQVVGSATFSDFGQPVVAESSGEGPALGDAACSGAGEGFVAYSDQARDTSFCYPADWVVDDLVEGCGFYAVSPAGVGQGRPLPKSLVLIYPPETVSGFGDWTVGAVEVIARPSVCFYPWLRQVLKAEGTSGAFLLNPETVAEIAGWILSDSPLVGSLTGNTAQDKKAVSIGGMTDGDVYGATVEAIIGSVIVGEPLSR